MKYLISLGFLLLLPLLSEAQNSLRNSKTLVVATYQYADNPRIANIEPLANYLREVMEVNTTVKSFPTVHQLLQAMRMGEVDIVFMNTFGYLMLRELTTEYEISAALNLPSEQSSNYKTIIVSNKESSINSLQFAIDNAGDNVLALVSPGSTSGNLVPRLKIASMLPADPETVFVEVQYRERHNLAVEVALTDKYAIAAFGSEEYYKLGADTVKLKKLWESPAIPLGPVVCKKSLPLELKKQLQQTLLELHLHNVPALEAVKAGWTEAKLANKFVLIDDSYYDQFMKLAGDKEKAMKIIRRFAR